MYVDAAHSGPALVPVAAGSGMCAAAGESLTARVLNPKPTLALSVSQLTSVEGGMPLDGRVQRAGRWRRRALHSAERQAVEAVVGAGVVVPELLALALEAHGYLKPLPRQDRRRVQHELETVREAVARALHVVGLEVRVRPPVVHSVAHVHRLVEVEVAHAHGAAHGHVHAVADSRALHAHVELPQLLVEIARQLKQWHQRESTQPRRRAHWWRARHVTLREVVVCRLRNHGNFVHERFYIR